MGISVLLATYRRPDILSKTLESFCRLNVDGLQWELIVIDNADDRDTQRLVKECSSQLPVTLIIETKPGKNNALNTALPIARGQVFVFTDDDIIADRNWLQEIWNGTERWPETFIFGGRVLPLWPAGCPCPDFSGPLFINAYSVADWNLPEGPYTVGKVFGANMIIRSDVFRQGWRFDERIGPKQTAKYIMGSETEFLVRLNKLGYEAVYLPKAVVYHQIRENQLEEKWLLSRAFRAGRGYAVNESFSDVPLLWGVPRFLIRKYLENRLKLFFAKDERFVLKMQDSMLKGKIYQHWHQNRKKNESC